MSEASGRGARRRGRRLGAVVAGCVLLGACASSARSSSTATTASGRAATTAADPAGERGWLDGAGSGSGGTGRSGASTTAGGGGTYAASATTAAAAGAPATYAASASTAAGASKSSEAAGDAAAPATPAGRGAAATAPPPQGRPLRAGSVDDNADFDGYLAYRSRQQQAGLRFRELDPTGRIVVRVVGSDGLPASGRKVRIDQGRTSVVTLTATADGTVRFLPRAYPGDQGRVYTATVDGSSVAVQPGATATLTLSTPALTQNRAKVDVLFLLDTTGSMGDEIDRLKATIHTVADRLAALPSQPDLRIGMTIYRDQGDEYVTRTFDFTSDVGAFTDALARVRAANGGDVPEAVDEALAEALAKPSWRSDALGLVFLVADAAPHVDRQVPTPYTDSIRDAAARGIKIFPVASSNTDDQAEFVFRQLAEATGARFVFLSYGAGGSAAVGPSSDITSSDYQELALDDLVVRLVAEELAARSGSSTPQLPPSPPRAPGQ